MCGRFGLSLNAADLAELLQLDLELLSGEPLEARYNIAPGQRSPVVRLDRAGRRRLHLVRWGLVPSWARDETIAHKLINARSETVSEKPSFREAFRRRRCLVPADGFYEWKQDGGQKVPHHIGRRGGEPFCFAGLWERWTTPTGEPLDTFTILTTGANDLLAPLHARMPVLLPEQAWDRWLDRRRPGEELTSLLAPWPAEDMEFWPVSTEINRVENDHPGLRERHEPEPELRLL